MNTGKTHGIGKQFRNQPEGMTGGMDPWQKDSADRFLKFAKDGGSFWTLENTLCYIRRGTCFTEEMVQYVIDNW